MINAGRMLRGTEPYNEPKNDLDRCAMEHDAIFNRNNNTEKDVREADIKFRECASKIKDKKLKYFFELQLAQVSKAVVKSKEILEDIGILPPDFYANINKSITDINRTLAKNHTIPSTKEEQQNMDKNFWYIQLMSIFRVGLEIILPILTRIGTQKIISPNTEKLIDKVKSLNININLLARVPENIKRIFVFLTNLLITGNDVSVIKKEFLSLGAQYIVSFMKGLLTDSDLFGTGVSGVLVKYGYTRVAEVLLDYFLSRVSTEFASDQWREGNVITKEELELIMKGEDPAINQATLKRDTEFTDVYKMSTQNVRVREIIAIFNYNLESLTNRQKIERFGNFNRAIIQIRNKKDYRDSVFNIIYILLNGTIQNKIVADITVEKLRNILEQKISQDDIRTIIDRPKMLENLEKIKNFPFDRLTLETYTYMSLINYILEDITSKNLEDLLS